MSRDSRGIHAHERYCVITRDAPGQEGAASRQAWPRAATWGSDGSRRKVCASRPELSYIVCMDAQITALSVIQAMLAPGVGISAVGLLLLGMSNRYGSIIARIRALNNEKRGFLKLLADGKTLEYADNVRHQSVVRQTESLLERTRFVRNGILSMQTGIGLFVLTSLCIGLSAFVDSRALQSVSLIAFLAGMIAVLTGIVFAALDVSRSFKVVELEVHTDD